MDFEKAFGRVKWTMMMNIFLRIGVDWRDIRLQAELYLQQEMIVRVDDKTLEPCMIGRGVRRGCLLPRLLFSTMQN